MTVYFSVEAYNLLPYVLSGLEDADWITSPNHPMPQRNQNLTTLSEALIVILICPIGGLLVQWRLWAVVSFE